MVPCLPQREIWTQRNCTFITKHSKRQFHDSTNKLPATQLLNMVTNLSVGKLYLIDFQWHNVRKLQQIYVKESSGALWTLAHHFISCCSAITLTSDLYRVMSISWKEQAKVQKKNNDNQIKLSGFLAKLSWTLICHCVYGSTDINWFRVDIVTY